MLAAIEQRHHILHVFGIDIIEVFNLLCIGKSVEPEAHKGGFTTLQRGVYDNGLNRFSLFVGEAAVFLVKYPG